MSGRFNCCILNHPCPIFCPFIDFTCSNEVVNPIVANSFGFFNNTVGGEVAAGGIIPVSLVLLGGEGGGILSNMGSVTLTPGTYEVNYFAGGVVPAGNSISISLALNGTTISGSTVSSTQSAGNTVNLTRTIVVYVENGGTLSLVNSTLQPTNFNFASVFIRRL